MGDVQRDYLDTSKTASESGPTEMVQDCDKKINPQFGFSANALRQFSLCSVQ